MLGVEAGDIVLGALRVVLDKDVRQRHRADLQPLVELATLRQVMQHEGAEAADRAFLDRDDDLMRAYKAVDQVGIERLGETRIGDRGREPVGAELLRRLQAFLQARAVAEQRDGRALLDDAAAADLERHALFRHFDADAVAPR